MKYNKPAEIVRHKTVKTSEEPEKFDRIKIIQQINQRELGSESNSLE